MTNDPSVSQGTIDHDAIWALALREAEAFHEREMLLATPDAEMRPVTETAKLIARRRGWRSLTERIAAGDLV